MISRLSGSILTDNLDPVIEMAYQCGDLTEKGVTMVVRFADNWSISGFDALLECRVVSENRIVDIIANRGGFDRCHVDKHHVKPDRATLAKVPFRLARRLHCIPLQYVATDNTLTCVVANPLDMSTQEALKQATGANLSLKVGEKTRIEYLLADIYPVDMQIPLSMGDGSTNASS